ncbi:MAG TPA: recombinase family protein [Steroidobacteraceae bacterium]|nr:recombinase family protein [Steroidobacteraceae bacterium]
MAPRKTVKPRCFSYVRWSSPEQAAGDSLRRQTAAAAAFAARHGYELDTEIDLRDAGVSAFRGRNASDGALGGFLKAVNDGLVAPGACLFVESLDRLSRAGPWDALPLLQALINQRIAIAFPPDRLIDLDAVRASPYLLFEVIGVLQRAHDESSMKSTRGKAAWAQKRERAARGEIQTARAPAWLRIKPPDTEDTRAKLEFEVIPDRAKLIKRMFSLFLAGRGKAAIAATFNAEKIPTWKPRGKGNAMYWHRGYIYHVLTSPAVCGIFIPRIDEHREGRKHHKPQEPIRDYFPRVIDDETFERAQLIAGEKRPPPRAARRSQASSPASRAARSAAGR